MRRIQWPFRRSRAVSRGRVLVSVVLIAGATAACNFLTTADEDPRRPPDVFDKVRAIDLLPRFPKPTGTSQTGQGEGSQPATYFGTGTASVGLDSAILRIDDGFTLSTHGGGQLVAKSAEWRFDSRRLSVLFSAHG